MDYYKNILLINFGGIGDEILFSPVIQSLRKTYPNAKITLCLEGRSSAFIQLTTLLNSHFYIDIKTKNKYIEMFKLYFKALFGRYDLVISAGGNPLIAFLLFLTGIKTRVGYNTSSFAKFFLTHTVTLNKNQYASKMYFDLVKPITNGEFELPYIEVEKVEKNQNSVLVHPGVSKISIQKGIIKSINSKEWAEVIKLLLRKGKNVYLAGGPDDKECIEKIREDLKNENLTNFIDMYGKTKNIIDLVRLINKSEVLICSDSAPMHIGIATNTKTIAVFGPTDDKTLVPESDRFITLKNNIDCRPCLWEKRQTTCEKLDCLKIDLNDFIKYL